MESLKSSRASVVTMHADASKLLLYNCQKFTLNEEFFFLCWKYQKKVAVIQYIYKLYISLF